MPSSPFNGTKEFCVTGNANSGAQILKNTLHSTPFLHITCPISCCHLGLSDLTNIISILGLSFTMRPDSMENNHQGIPVAKQLYQQIWLFPTEHGCLDGNIAQGKLWVVLLWEMVQQFGYTGLSTRLGWGMSRSGPHSVTNHILWSWARSYL